MTPESSAADHPRDDREDQVHRADVLVVGRIDVAPPAGGMAVRRAASAWPWRMGLQVVMVSAMAAFPLSNSSRRRRDVRRHQVIGGSVALASSTMPACKAAIQASNSSLVTTRTAIGMKAWSLPQSSEHWP